MLCAFIPLRLGLLANFTDNHLPVKGCASRLRLPLTGLRSYLIKIRAVQQLHGWITRSARLA